MRAECSKRGRATAIRGSTSPSGIGYAKLFHNPRVNWLYQTEPEPELNGRRIGQPRGKVLGGSSSINGLIYIRGQHEDFDVWRQLGCTGWAWEDVKPYFLRAEDQESIRDEWHGQGGPLAVSDPRDRHPLVEAFIKSGESVGLPRNDDFNGAAQEGIGYFQNTMKGGRRWSTAKGYLVPARSRQNLKIETEALATRILFDGKRAAGVEYRRGGEARRAEAKGEVLLCGGAINSPQLLELSGIGDGERLRGLGVDVLHHAPQVGENLQDHFQVRIVMECAQKITVNDQYRNLLRRAGMGLDYLFRRRGPLAVAAGFGTAFFRAMPQSATPDTQVHFLTFSTDKMGESLHDFSGFTASICVLRPESRGSVHVTSTDPSQAPEIRANYLSEEADRRTSVEGLKVSAPHPARRTAVALRNPRGDARIGGRERRCAARLLPRLRYDDLSPDLHLRDGVRRGCRGDAGAEGQRRRVPARGRRLRSCPALYRAIRTLPV